MLTFNSPKKADAPILAPKAEAPKIESKEIKTQPIHLFKSEQFLQGYSSLYKEETLDLSRHGTFHPEDITLHHTTTVGSDSINALVTLEDMQRMDDCLHLYGHRRSLRVTPSHIHPHVKEVGGCLASVTTGGKVQWCQNIPNHAHLTATLTGHTDRINVATSANISMKDLGYVSAILTGSSDKTIRIWNISDGSCLKTLGGFFSGHSGAVTTLTIFDATLTFDSETGYYDHDYLASGSSDTSIRLWNLNNGTCIAKLTGHTGIVTALTWLSRPEVPDRYGKYSEFRWGHLVSGSSDNTLRIWDITTTGKCEATVSASGSITALIALPDEKFASAAGKNIQLWSSPYGIWQSRYTLSGHTDIVTSLTLLQDKKYLASGSQDSHIRVWDTTDGTCLKILTGHTGPVTALTFYSKPGFLVSASSDKSLRFWYTPLRPLTYTDIIPLLNVLKANTEFIETYRDRREEESNIFKEHKRVHKLHIEHLNLQNVQLGSFGSVLTDLQALLKDYRKLTKLNLQNTGLLLDELRVLHTMACNRTPALVLQHEMMEQLHTERLAEEKRLHVERLAEEQRLHAERLAKEQRLQAEWLAEQQRLRAREAHAREVERIRKENLQILFNRAQGGEASAQYEVAMRYLKGEEVVHDEKLAIEWCRKAAAQKYQNAQYFLGECYDKGRGVIQDERTAIKWYKKAANQGHAAAQQRLLELGEDLPPPVQAVPATLPILPSFEECLRISSAHGANVSQEHLFTSFIPMSEIKATISSKISPEIELLLSEAAQGEASACYKLGYCYAKALYGVTADNRQVFTWFMKAAEQGFADAERNVARCYEHGIGVAPNLQTAVTWYQRAVAHGNVKAKTELAKLLQKIAEHEREVSLPAISASSSSSRDTKEINDLRQKVAQLKAQNERMVDLNIPATDLVYEARLGGGSYGIVYKGQWQGKTVAIKTIHAENDSQIKALKNEFRRLVELTVTAGEGPEQAAGAARVVKFLGCSPSKPFCIVMEYAPGGSLWTYLHGSNSKEYNTKPVLAGEQQYRLIRDVCLGLEFLHRQKIQHRDIKSMWC